MKTLAGLFLSALLTGCVGMPSFIGEEVMPPTVEQPKKEQTGPPPIVLPEQVTAKNTAYIIQALKAEMDHDAGGGR